MLLATLVAAASFQPLNLRAVGDIMLARGVEKRGVDPFKTMKADLRSADILFGNLECALTTKKVARNKPYILKAHPNRSQWLQSAGFDVLSLNNNHAGYCDSVGFFETAFTLQSRDIIPLTEEPVILTSKGHRIGFVAYTDFGRDACAGMSIFTMSRLKQDLLRIDAPIRVVSIHWGIEGTTTPSKRQRELAKLMAEAGVDLIIGHGPHVLQPVERIGGCIVAYSLGDFVFDINKPPRSEGAVLDVLIDGPGISAYRMMPVVSGYQPKWDPTRKIPPAPAPPRRQSGGTVPKSD
jgi:Bacterial capsule synthesis protein PGA_cap